MSRFDLLGIHQWAVSYSDNRIINSKTLEQNSFFEKRNDTRAYIHEYGFNTASELLELLEVLWEKDEYMQEIIKTILVAAMKNRPQKNQNDDRISALPSDHTERKMAGMIYQCIFTISERRSQVKT